MKKLTALSVIIVGLFGLPVPAHIFEFALQALSNKEQSKTITIETELAS